MRTHEINLWTFCCFVSDVLLVCWPVSPDCPLISSVCFHGLFVWSPSLRVSPPMTGQLWSLRRNQRATTRTDPWVPWARPPTTPGGPTTLRRPTTPGVPTTAPSPAALPQLPAHPPLGSVSPPHPMFSVQMFSDITEVLSSDILIKSLIFYWTLIIFD